MCILGTESFVKHPLIWQKLHFFRRLHFEASVPILAYSGLRYFLFEKVDFLEDNILSFYKN